MKGHWIPPSPKEIIEKIKTKLGYSKTIPSGLGNDLVDAVSTLKTRTETIAKTFVKTVGPLTPVNGVLDATFPDSDITAEMKATKLEVSDSSVFLDTVSVTCDVNNGAGYIRIQCSNMSGTCNSATITIETVAGSSGITSVDFDVLNGRIGDLSTLTTTAKTSAVVAINELNSQIGDLIPVLNSAVNNTGRMINSGETFLYQSSLYFVLQNIPVNEEWANKATAISTQLSRFLTPTIKQYTVSVTANQYITPYSYLGTLDVTSDRSLYGDIISAYGYIGGAIYPCGAHIINPNLVLLCSGQSEDHTVVVVFSHSIRI